MKIIDDNLGGTTPLDLILKFPSKIKESRTMNFLNGKKKMKMKINLNTGLQEIKLIKF